MIELELPIDEITIGDVVYAYIMGNGVPRPWAVPGTVVRIDEHVHVDNPPFGTSTLLKVTQHVDGSESPSRFMIRRPGSMNTDLIRLLGVEPKRSVR